MGTMTMIRKNGTWVPTIQLDWVAVSTASLINGFATQPANPLAWANVEMAGGRYLLLRGTVITPNPKPTAVTMAMSIGSLPAQAFTHDFFLYNSAGAGWNVVGRRSRWQVLNSTLYYVHLGSDVPGEINDMAALGAVRLA